MNEVFDHLEPRVSILVSPSTAKELCGQRRERV